MVGNALRLRRFEIRALACRRSTCRPFRQHRMNQEKRLPRSIGRCTLRFLTKIVEGRPARWATSACWMPIIWHRNPAPASPPRMAGQCRGWPGWCKVAASPLPPMTNMCRYLPTLVFAISLAFFSAGRRSAASMEMIAITTKSSIRVKCRIVFMDLVPYYNIPLLNK